MPVTIEPMLDAAAKEALCAAIAAELPMWFGRPDSNARYAAGMRERDAFAAIVDGIPCGLIALEYQFGVTCNVWWLGVRPGSHRHGLGRALIDRAAQEARKRGCRQMAVLTMSPRADSPEYHLTRAFYEAMGFASFVEFEPEPGDWMMWMVNAL
jgi:ribosomal protein S18 acetylase RimI-like enzyme